MSPSTIAAMAAIGVNMATPESQAAVVIDVKIEIGLCNFLLIFIFNL